MPLPPPDTKEFTARLEALAVECRAELESASQSLQEIALLLSQSLAEVDRLSQRELQLANRVREMETNIESYARKDIRELYHAAHDAELRLMMMRSQVEQLQEREKSIRVYQDKLRLLLELAEAQLKAGDERVGAAESRARAVSRSAGNVPLGDLVQAREDERLHVARLVMESPAQALSNVLLQTEICDRLIENDPVQARAELAELRGAAARSLTDMRLLLFELRPLMLEEIGITPTLRRYLADVARLTGAEATVAGPPSDDKIPGVLRAPFYRIIQQLTAAAVRDAAGRLAVDVRYEDAQVVGRLDARGRGLARGQAIARLVADDRFRRHIDELGADLQVELVTDDTVRLTLVIPVG